MNTASDQPAIRQDRQIRVFISSTFRDMQAERDHLVKFIFPQLRKLCESRGVTWGEVDLRWGVTDEQAAEGKVLPICLEEIKRCRPYFIGLLGERYGWVPESISEELLEKEEWLREQFKDHKSVTELEILHGVLNDPKMAGHAFFYFRDPAYLDTVAENDRKDFIAENAKDAEKLRALKDRIRQSKFAVRDGYRNPQVVGRAIRRDLTRIINQNWPEGSQPDPLDREAIDHEAYAQSRERVYIGREEYFDQLDAYASCAAAKSSPSPPAAGGEGRGEVGALCVLGESGSGKSALLANWIARYRQAHPDALVLQHYIGATPYSADWVAMLRRLMGEFKRRLGLQQDIPDQPDALRSAFPNWLYMAAAKVAATPSSSSSKIIIVLDALNQLEDRDGAPDLVWLPSVLPENVRLIVSTLPGRPLDEIQKRHWPTLKVELLSADERRKLIADYLAQHAKALNATRVERIANAPPSANPLYLRVLLDELRLVRAHEELEERIGDYLKAESPYALYEKVIARWEQDYEGDSDLVGDTLSLLWAARRGLTETELLQALGKDGEPLPRAKWSPLFLAMSDALISRGGLLTFAHDFLRTAIKNAYLPTEQNRQRAHLRLADYFERQPLYFRFRDEKHNRDISPFFNGNVIADALDHIAPRPYNRRKIEEQPWQAKVAKEWRKLSFLLSDLNFFQAIWDNFQEDTESNWKEIQTQIELAIPIAYECVIGNPEKYSTRLLWAIGRLLSENRFPHEAVEIQNCILKRTKDNIPANILAVSNFAQTLSRLNDTVQAMEIINKVRKDMAQNGISFAIAPLLFEAGRIHYYKGNFREALHHLRESSLLCRNGMNWSGDLLGQILVYRALAHGGIGEIDASVRLAAQGVDELRSGQSRKLLAWGLSVSGLILKTADNRAAAFTAWNEAQSIYSELHDYAGMENISKQLFSLK